MIDAYHAYHRSRGWANTTADRRRGTLRQFAAAIAPKPLAEATRLDVEAFLGSKESVRTRHAYRSDLRGFYRWAVDHDLLEDDPTAKVDPVKVPKGGPRPLPNPAAVEAAIAAARPRVAARIALGFYAGLRVSEIAALRAEDVNLRMGTLTVRAGKGGKDRTVDVHPALAAILAGMMPESGPLFPGSHDGHVSGEAVAATIVRHLSKHGIDAVSHQLRHTFGTELTRVTGGDLVTVGSEMGHESTETTQGYAGWAGRGAAAVAAMYGGDAA